jgi:hypothetical protein
MRVSCRPWASWLAPASMLSALSALAVTSSFAAEQATPFDGHWNITMVCPPHNDDDEAKGYTHRFPAEVVNGQLHATHGTEGEPGWHLLTGPIADDGSATLRLEGIVNNPNYAINKAQRGHAYKYRVRAQFDKSSGTGQRLTGRTCTFAFKR